MLNKKPCLIREEISLGEETSKLIQSLRVMVMNLSSVGVEVVKNLVFLNVKKIGLFDNTSIQSEDPSNSLFYSSDLKGKNKASTIKKWIEDNNMDTVTEIFKNNFNEFD